MILTVTMNPAIDVSASTERVAPINKLRCADVRHDPGGGGINVARVVQRFGGECRALFPAGGCLGQLLLSLLAEEGVVSLLVGIAAETRQSFTVLERRSGLQYRFVLPGPGLRRPEWQACLETLESLPLKPAYVVASGSLPPGVEDDFYAQVARLAVSIGARMVVDTSGPALKAALDAGVYLVKPNLRELRELTGLRLQRQPEWEAAASDLVGAGKAEVVALTLGNAGAFLVTREKRLRAPGLKIEAASTVGAGDSFLGAMVWRLSRGGSLEESFRYGVAAGTAALLMPGTDLCRVADVERLCADVRLERQSAILEG